VLLIPQGDKIIALIYLYWSLLMVYPDGASMSGNII